MNVAMRVINANQFQKTLGEYASFTKKTAAAACNRQMLNVAIKGMQSTKEASAGEIQALKNKDWWPKYIAKNLAGKKFGKVTAAYAKSEKRGKSAQERFMKRAYTREQARRYSEKILKSRTKSIKFSKFFFVSMGKAIKPFAKTSGKTSIGKTFRGFANTVKPATPQDSSCRVVVEYDYVKRKERAAQGATRLLRNSLDIAMKLATADMKNYMASEIRKLAARLSARTARTA